MSIAHPTSEVASTPAASPTRLTDDSGRWTRRVRPAWATLREVAPAQLREHLTAERARQIVQDQREDKKELQRDDDRSEKTKAAYRTIFRQQLCRHADDLQEDFDLVEATLRFILRADLRSKSWDNYRTAFVFALNERVEEEAGAYGREHWDTAMALALLLIVERQPADNRSEEDTKTVSQADLMMIMGVIDAMRSQSASHRERQAWPERAKIALRATMATGLRPAEWQNAHANQAEPEMISTTYPFDRLGETRDPTIFVIDLINAKRKAPQEEASRSLLLRNGPEVYAVLQHLHTLRRYVAEDAPEIKVTQAHSVYHDRCSRIIREACQVAWPEEPRRWISLKTLRFQVAANCKRRFGKRVAALMMGHAPSVGRNSYPGPEASWDPLDHTFSEWSVRPSAELVALAKAGGVRRSGADRVAVVENTAPALVASALLLDGVTNEAADLDDAIDAIDQPEVPS